MSAQQTIIDWLENFVKDVTTLDVATFAGNLTVDPVPAGQDFKLDNIFNSLKGNVGTGSELTLVALTHIDVDADSTSFVSSGLTADQKELIAYHAKAVEAAQTARSSMVKLAMDVVT